MDTLKNQRLKAKVLQTLNVMEIVDGGPRSHVPEMAGHAHPLARCRTDRALVARPLRGQVRRAYIMD